MVTDSRIDDLIQPIINIYNEMEYELIIAIAKRFDTYDDISGTLEWHIKKLNELGALTNETVKLIAKYSKKSETEIRKLIRQAGFLNIDLEDLTDAYKAHLISVNPTILKASPVLAQTLDNSYKELKSTLSLIQTNALNSTQKAYINVLNKAYLDVASGTYDYNTAISNAIQEMSRNGITGATYRRGNVIVQYSLEGTVRRDVLTAVHQTANRATMDICEEMEAEYVEVSRHLGARVHPTNPIANHAGWQGKVFKINGSDDKYPNLTESTGYPDDILGLGGVNCRHRMFPFFPGFSIPKPATFSDGENERIYKATQKQRRYERDIRTLKKQMAAAKVINDKETVKKLRKKLDDKYNQINAHCKAYGLRRDYARERVSEQL